MMNGCVFSILIEVLSLFKMQVNADLGLCGIFHNDKVCGKQAKKAGRGLTIPHF